MGTSDLHQGARKVQERGKIMVNKELAEVSVSKIVPYENNPRINDRAVDAVKKSIEQCDYVFLLYWR